MAPVSLFGARLRGAMLTRSMSMRTSTECHSGTLAQALRACIRICTRESWHPIELPECLDGYKRGTFVPTRIRRRQQTAGPLAL